MKLYPYQEKAVRAVEAELHQNKRTLLVMPTGTGKTVVFSEIARRLIEIKHRARVLVLAHRRELLQQAESITAAAGLTVGIEQGSRFALGRCNVIVASVQTMAGERRLASWNRSEFDLIIVDEAHHAVAAGYRRVLAHFDARVLGVTATPDRLDGTPLGEIFKTTAHSISLLDAINGGMLCSLLAHRVVLKDVNLSGVRILAGDLNAGDLAKVMEQERSIHGVALSLLELAGARKTVLFTVSVEQARAIAEIMNRARPGCALALDGKAKKEDRAAAVQGFKDGEFQYLINCNLYTEGFDEPSVECVAVARPTCSRALYTQMLGRGLRLHPGKVDCLVLDFTGNSSRHELAGPVDALAGRKLTEREAARCARELEDGTPNVATIIDRMESEAVVTYKTEEQEAWIAPPAGAPGIQPDMDAHALMTLPPIGSARTSTLANGDCAWCGRSGHLTGYCPRDAKQPGKAVAKRGLSLGDTIEAKVSLAVAYKRAEERALALSRTASTATWREAQAEQNGWQQDETTRWRTSRLSRTPYEKAAGQTLTKHKPR